MSSTPLNSTAGFSTGSSRAVVIDSNANVSGNHLSVSSANLGNLANVKITGGSNNQTITTDGYGNLTWTSFTSENANYANYSGNTNIANYSNTTFSVTGSNVVGTVANANYSAYAGNVTLSGQSNITSLGTLTGLTVNGTSNLGSISNVKITGGSNNQILTTDGSGNLSWITGSIPAEIEYGQVVQSSNIALSVGNSSSTTTLITFTLPSAGTWRVTYIMHGYGGGTSGGTYAVYDNTGTIVANSEIRGIYTNTGLIASEATGVAIVTTTGSATYTIRGWAQTASSNSLSFADGRSKVVYEKISGVLSNGIANGSSNISVAANSNVTVGVSGNSNVVIITGSGANINGILSVSSNLSVNGNFIVGSQTWSDAWITYTPTWTASSTNPTLGNGIVSGRYKQIGKTVFFQMKLLIGGTTTTGSGHWRFTLPVTAYNADSVIVSMTCMDNGTQWYTGQAFTAYDGNTSYIVGVVGNTVVSSSSPFTWGNLDTLTITGSYESV